MENKKVGVLAKIEAKIAQLHEIDDQIKLAKHNKELLKKALIELMKENKMTEHTITVGNGLKDIKASINLRSITKLDKESLAQDLGVPISEVGKKDTLIKLTEEGRLSHNTYKNYEFEEVVEVMTIRATN